MPAFLRATVIIIITTIIVNGHFVWPHIMQLDLRYVYRALKVD